MSNPELHYGTKCVVTAMRTSMGSQLRNVGLNCHSRTASGVGLVEASGVKGQSGNPAFLATILEGIRLEAKLTGTEAARQQRVEGHLRLETDLVAALHAERGRVAALKRARAR